MYQSAVQYVISTAILVALVATPVAAQSREERARLDDIAKIAAQQFTAAKAEADQTRPSVPPPTGGEVALGLDDATARALERNLELAVERLNPQTFDLNIA